MGEVWGDIIIVWSSGIRLDNGFLHYKLCIYGLSVKVELGVVSEDFLIFRVRENQNKFHSYLALRLECYYRRVPRISNILV